MLFTLTGLLLGLLQGLRHAFEPDHLAAVSTMVAERRAARATAWVGAAWGLGHALTLLCVGGALILLRARMPSWVEDASEVFVAIMLVVLGIRSLVRAVKDGRSGPPTEHAHHGEKHVHAGTHDHVHLDGWTLARRPLLVGLVHGLAGSGALTALVMSKLPTLAASLWFIVLFGAGATIGMALLTGLLGWPLSRMARSPRALPVLMGLTGAASLVVGVVWGAKILV
jgi:ABC-type nickel/cobalt efflux system permease component RcnA